MHARTGVAALAAAVAVAGLAAGAGSAASHWTVRFLFVPDRVYQGKPASVKVIVRSPGARCSLAVRYADGSAQPGIAPTRAVAGRASWTWQLALDAPAGAAKAAVSCGRNAHLSRTFVVVGGTSVPAKLTVVASGYSQRPQRGLPGSVVSYGIQLNNPSNTEDAKDVTVLVNALDASGTVLGSGTSRIPYVGAASVFDVGGTVSLPTTTTVARLEIVVQSGGHVPHQLHEPAVENVHVVPSTFEPDWVGSVDGDVVNDDPVNTLTNAQLSIVLFDSAGNIVGGGTGFMLAQLPPGTRSFFSATLGFSNVPTAKASTAQVSLEPTYTAPGA